MSRKPPSAHLVRSRLKIRWCPDFEFHVHCICAAPSLRKWGGDRLQFGALNTEDLISGRAIRIARLPYPGLLQATICYLGPSIRWHARSC